MIDCWKENKSKCLNHKKECFVTPERIKILDEPLYPIGTKLKVINGGKGAYGANGTRGIVVPWEESIGNCMGLNKDKFFMIKKDDRVYWGGSAT